MSENLGNFLVDLACDPALMAQFLGDPGTVLARTSLSDEERTLVMTRDSRLLAGALGTTSYSVGQIIEIPRGVPTRKKAPGKKKKTPGKKKAPRKTPAKKTPARKRPSRKAPARKTPARKTR